MNGQTRAVDPDQEWLSRTRWSWTTPASSPPAWSANADRRLEFLDLFVPLIELTEARQGLPSAGMPTPDYTT